MTLDVISGVTIQLLKSDSNSHNLELVSDFENRKQEIKRRLLSIFEEISHAREGDEMVDLKDKSRGIFRALESASTRRMLDTVETGILSLQNDLNRAKMDFH